MNPLVFNMLLLIVGFFVVIGLTALPALLQWPVPASQARPGRMFAGPRMAGGGWS